jgi:hypothetical protein
VSTCAWTMAWRSRVRQRRAPSLESGDVLWKVHLQAFDSCPHLHERHLFLLLTRRWHCWGEGDRNRAFPLPMLLNATISTDTLF